MVTPTPPFGIFTWDAISLTMTVQSADDSASGPAGEIYTVAIPPESRDCSSSTTDVTFTVEILCAGCSVVDPCLDAVLTIDADN